MSQVYMDNLILSNIADAIRTELNSTNTYLPSEMADAISSIGASPTIFRIRKKLSHNLRDWPDWNEASWEDIKYIIDEVALGLKEELPGDIVVGVMKQWPIGDKHIIFRLEEINERQLIFKSITKTELGIEDFHNESTYFHSLLSDDTTIKDGIITIKIGINQEQEES